MKHYADILSQCDSALSMLEQRTELEFTEIKPRITMLKYTEQVDEGIDADEKAWEKPREGARRRIERPWAARK
jgi:hypothetical protein